MLQLTSLRVNPHEGKNGMLAFASFEFSGLVLDGVILRKNAQDGYSLKMPAKDTGKPDEAARKRDPQSTKTIWQDFFFFKEREFYEYVLSETVGEYEKVIASRRQAGG